MSNDCSGQDKVEESPAIAFVYKEAAAQGINASERLFFAQCPHLPSLRAPLKAHPDPCPIRAPFTHSELHCGYAMIRE